MGFVRKVTGASDAKKAAGEASQAQVRATEAAIKAREEAAERAQEFFVPFAGITERGIEGASFLADPQAQFQFLQDNPLFDLALENVNRQTQQAAASRGRLSAGDTLQQLSQNVLLSAEPLIDRQRQDISNLLGFGGDIAASQANIETGQAAGISDLITQGGAAQAAGIIGRQQASPSQLETFKQGVDILGSVAGLFGGGGGFGFSDPRLKTNINLIGSRNGHNWYSWDWNEKAHELGLSGSSEGVLSTEVPHAVFRHSSGYDFVDYGAL